MARQQFNIAVSLCLLGSGSAWGADTGQSSEDRGRRIVADRQLGLCLLCHTAPIPEERFQGNLGPSLTGVGARYTAVELRRRVAQAREINPQSIMPSYGQSLNLQRVTAAQQGRPLLSDTQIDDVVAYLLTLR
jgi:L-cysteine S-thiosulfotransferase